MIEIKNISKTFKNNKVLDGIDLTINQGDVVAIIGPSGTGKSTFLRCVDRLEKPETGTITIGKRPAWFFRISIFFQRRQHFRM